MSSKEKRLIFNGQQKTGKNSTWRRRQGFETTKASGGIPILRFGRGNNFHKFKQSLSELSLKEYGNLGKLIQKGSHFEPVYEPPMLPENITNQMQNALTLEALKEYH
jgi:hypothetical protein